MLACFANGLPCLAIVFAQIQRMRIDSNCVLTRFERVGSVLGLGLGLGVGQEWM